MNSDSDHDDGLAVPVAVYHGPSRIFILDEAVEALVGADLSIDVRVAPYAVFACCVTSSES